MIQNTLDDLNQLAAMWIEAKAKETSAIDERRQIEDRIKSLVGVAENMDGVETASPGKFTIKIQGRIDRKVDSDKLQELAAEHGLTDHLSSLFRWKPEINLSAWKRASAEITHPLALAITAKPGRASFSITPIQE